MTRFVFLFCFVLSLFTSSILCAQGLMYYPFTSQVSVSTNPTKKIWLDSKWQTNSFFSSLSTEISPFLNISPSPKARLYVGAGIQANFIPLLTSTSAEITEGYFATVGVRSALFAAYPQIQVGFELSPYVHRSFEIGLIRTSLGIGYYFKN